MSPLWDTDGRVHLIEETEAQLPKWLTDSHSKKGSGRPGRGPHCRSPAVLSSSQGDVICIHVLSQRAFLLRPECHLHRFQILEVVQGRKSQRCCQSGGSAEHWAGNHERSPGLGCLDVPKLPLYQHELLLPSTSQLFLSLPPTELCTMVEPQCVLGNSETTQR